MFNINLRVLAFILTALGAADAPVGAQPYPTQAIRVIVPVAPGGPTDILTRAVSPRLGEALGQQILVENRPGAGGGIAATAVARAAPDGYTLLLADMSFATGPSLYKPAQYSIKDQFTPVGLMAVASLVLVVHPSLPSKNVKEFVALARSQPGKLSYGAAPGTPTHLGPEVLKESYGLDMVSVPYKGIAPALTDLVGGRLTFAMVGVSVAKPFLDSGKLRVLAVTGHKRAIALPDVLTFAEGGVPLAGMDSGSWWGLTAPAGVSREIVSKLNSALAKAISVPEVRDRLTAMNFDPSTGSPEAFGALIEKEAVKWARVIQRAGIKID